MFYNICYSSCFVLLTFNLTESLHLCEFLNLATSFEQEVLRSQTDSKINYLSIFWTIVLIIVNNQ